jgi:alkylation response protein AidB-like acyl-CoA dehydrogenase
VNLELTDDEQLLRDSCASLFKRHAGTARARALTESRATDTELMTALDEAGMLDLALDPEIGPIGAQFVSEWASEAAAVAPVGWRCLVAPHVIPGDIPPVVAIMWGGSGSLCRYAEDADVLLSVQGDDVHMSRRGDWSCTPVPSRYGFPLSNVEILASESLGPDAANALNRWAKVSLATEIAGAGRSAVQLTVQYVKDREQFGRALGTYQTIQHRLAECYVSIEALSLLAKEAAFFDATEERAAVAATYACDIAHRVFTDLHQFTGAMGFAKEYDLYLWSMKIQFLAQEAGGLPASSDALCDARWGTRLARWSPLQDEIMA